MDKVCGSGDECENTCPVMLMGRICPTPAEFVNELQTMMSEVVA